LKEFRILDYGQCTKTHDQAQFISENEGNVRKFAIDMAWHNGRIAMREKNQIS
tara:strand:- start:199 stop:357 length:159 start_codon:yes stop_codon:yes gene_type:complete